MESGVRLRCGPLRLRCGPLRLRYGLLRLRDCRETIQLVADESLPVHNEAARVLEDVCDVEEGERDIVGRDDEDRRTRIEVDSLRPALLRVDVTLGERVVVHHLHCRRRIGDP
jgi:hypothetical protein